MMQSATTQQRPQSRPFAVSLARPESKAVPKQVKIATRGLNFYYGDQQALFDNNLEIAANRVTAIIGPSGCGKSTHLRTYNRIFELYRGQRVSGEVLLDGQNILEAGCDVLELR
ncbi:MAG: ATP-binding cassette domain-containing protein, partial [Desulfuromonadales bacterium]|nr:ATP-binding cassette domain-containing protein [Desulfuromonadales bacterium]